MLKVWDETNIPRFELCISPRDDIFLILTFQPGILSHQHLLNLLDTKNMIRQSPSKISGQSGDILTSEPWLVTGHLLTLPRTLNPHILELLYTPFLSLICCDCFKIKILLVWLQADFGIFEVCLCLQRYQFGPDLKYFGRVKYFGLDGMISQKNVVRVVIPITQFTTVNNEAIGYNH